MGAFPVVVDIAKVEVNDDDNVDAANCAGVID